MKNISIIAIIPLCVFLLSCEKEDDMMKDTSGSITLEFTNVVGSEDLSLVEEGSEVFDYENTLGQAFNIDFFGYYISEISLTGDASIFEDEVFADANESKGFYLVHEGADGSGTINFSEVPSGTYSSITFTLGIDGTTVEEGALGGILNPDDGAWFWSWNAGYIAFRLEGSSSSAGSENNQFTFHVGGWNEPNNIKQITLDLANPVVVGNGTSSMINIQMDALKALSGNTDVDFESTFMVHSPAAGQPIANNLSQAFSIHHVMNDM